MIRRFVIAVSASALVLSGCASSVHTEDGLEAPPPMPPPPAPPPPPPPVMAAPLMVTGSRIAPGQVNGVQNSAERYADNPVAGAFRTADAPVSTFSVDVDTGAYANARRFLTMGQLPPPDAVRTEEFINYFRYALPAPASRTAPFTVTTDVMQTPWNASTALMRVALRGYDVPRSARPAANLVFLVDVSGSMASDDKLPLVKAALTGLADELRPDDKVSIVTYASGEKLLLEPTSDKAKVRAALDKLVANGSTAGERGLRLAYETARSGMIAGGINRVLLATDGDFNVGITSDKELVSVIEKERDSGVTLSTLGFGTGNFNDSMMEKIADAGNGNYSYIDSALEARKVLGEELSSTLFTIASDVKIQVEFNPAQVREYRLLGYENRALREEDFNNDKVDAGDIGAGHQVTAIYEIVPAGSPGWSDPRRYAAPAGTGKGGELAFVKLRYKRPGSSTSQLISRAVPASARFTRQARPDFAFAAAVAAFAQKLRGDRLMGGFSYQDVKALAGPQSDYYRSEFLRLVDVAGARDKR
ncbi:vWA domain-containing protein [Parablastomonas sp. CN1-191]|uniref:vWA domain-containing protein n=1 Tax=Parablastomonas sp. CN1-191 TaxID=3400908 RepID=UPI003BF78261